jgi:GNAT superfamily N-acetyltransferase
MLRPHCDPPVSAKSADPFLQTIRLTSGDQVIGRARWISAAEPADGVVQILELTVADAHRRKGHGRQLMEALTEQCLEHFKLRNLKLRRIWLSLDQKRQVIARAFLMKFTFNHVGTVKELLKDQDMLIYMRAFD